MTARRPSRTKPRQAGSKSSLDKWEREVLQVKVRVNKVRFSLDHALVKLQRKLTRLITSIQRAERR
jgi:hypothetical protein